MPSIQSIIIWPERYTPPVRVTRAENNGSGIRGDHFSKRGRITWVTLIAHDDLATVAAVVGFQWDVHMACRPNILVDTLPDVNLKGIIVSLGDEVLLEIIGFCAPCFRMEENFGTGGINAFLKKAGWVERVIKSEAISVLDLFFVK